MRYWKTRKDIRWWRAETDSFWLELRNGLLAGFAILIATVVILFLLLSATHSETLPAMEPVSRPIPHRNTPLPTLAVQLRNSRILPPAEYDRLFDGKLDVVTVSSEQELLQRCNLTRAAFIIRPMACALRYSPSQCTIVMLGHKVIESEGYTVDIVLRHERGHCNGWTKDHKGARTWNEASGK